MYYEHNNNNIRIDLQIKESCIACLRTHIRSMYIRPSIIMLLTGKILLIPFSDVKINMNPPRRC
jgi:hypothetical protein